LETVLLLDSTGIIVSRLKHENWVEWPPVHHKILFVTHRPIISVHLDAVVLKIFFGTCLHSRAFCSKKSNITVIIFDHDR